MIRTQNGSVKQRNKKKKASRHDQNSKFAAKDHIIAKKGDKIKAFIGANTTLGILIMRFDNQEKMLDMMDNSEKWIKVLLK